MGSFALVSIPVDLSRRKAAAEVALDVVATFPGTRNATIDDAGVLSFEMQFPGNLSALVVRLQSCLVPVGSQATLSMPVRRIGPACDADSAYQSSVLEAGPEISDVQFPRGEYVLSATIKNDALEAAIVPSTRSMHHLYDALLRLRLLADSASSAAVS